jgi:hypothetical protein
VVAAVTGQALGLAALAVLTGLHHTTPWVLVTVACLHQAFAQAAGTGWASWFGEVVPASLRGSARQGPPKAGSALAPSRTSFERPGPG